MKRILIFINIIFFIKIEVNVFLKCISKIDFKSDL